MKKTFIAISVICLIVLAALYGWRTVTKRQNPRGIILISIDTLRADHLGIYGYHRDTSPAIDAFANQSVVFDRAAAHSPLTLPSHMSIMTSLYPFSHGILSNANRLADKHVTLAELLQEEGYKTAGFADGLFMKGSYGFQQGFDIYDGDTRIGIANILPKAVKWLEENKSNPFFLFIHCYDVHDPYFPPPPYDTIFHEYVSTGTFVPNTQNLKDAAWKGLEVTDADLQHIKALYDGGIRYTDGKIGEFLTYLDGTGLMDTSLIIITSDHGEEFGEHGSFLHWQLYFRPNLHVPLIMHVPGFTEKMIRIEDLVQSVDILPTILDIMALSPHPDAQGITLLPLIKRNSNLLERFWWYIRPSFLKHENTPDGIAATKFRKRQSSIIRDGYQLIYTMTPVSEELFDLRDDPLAQNNIAGNHGALVKQLLAELNRIQEELPIYNASTVILDEATRKELESLGYVDDAEPAPVDPDTTAKVEYHWLEAEHADIMVSPFKISTDKNASNGRFVYVPQGIGNEYARGGTITATYTATISQPGTYILWGRVQARDGNDNSFFVQIDEGPDNLWEVETGEQWHWDHVNDRDVADPAHFVLAEGEHIIKIKLREDGTKLDKLLLTNDVNFVPQ